MVHSTWGPAFVRDEIERVNPDGLSTWFLGCNGFVLRSKRTTVYVDPYFGDGVPPRNLRMIPVPMDPRDATLCDAVLITHEHLDHMHPPSFGPLVETLGADIYAPRTAFEQPGEDHPLRAPREQRVVVRPGDAYEIGDLTVHVREANDPDAVEAVSYVVEHDAGVFFHGGDSRHCDAFSEIGTAFDVDLGALAIGSAGRKYDPTTNTVDRRKYYLDETEIIEVSNALRLDRLLPTHYDVWKGVRCDPAALHHHASTFEYPHVIEWVEVGDRIDVSRPGRILPQWLTES